MKLEGKKVVVTGADGFIGSHLVERLVREGANVKALVQYNSFNSWGNLEDVQKDVLKEIEVVQGNVRDYDSMKRLIKGTEVVFHLAALIAIPYSYESPMAYVKTNVEGTANVMEACRDYGVEKIVHTSTSETYGTALYVPIDEKHPMQAQSPYSASKMGGDKIVESYFKSFDLPVTTLRPFNTYGPRQSARAVIPTIISQVVSGKDSIKLGALSPLRDFNYVKDTAEAFVQMAKSDHTIGEVINSASKSEISIGDLAKKIIDISGREIEILCDEQRLRPEKSEVNRLFGDNEKILRLTDWKPAYSIERGLQETYRWVEKNIHKFKTDIYNK